MVNRIIPLLLCTVLAAQDAGPRSWNSPGSWGPRASNHLLHFEAGLLIGGAAYGVASWLGYGDPKSPNWFKRNTTPMQHAIAWAVIAGWKKEDQDNRYPGVRGSWPDFTWTVAGGVTIGVALHYATRKPPTEAYAMAPRLAPLPLEPLPAIPSLVSYPEMEKVAP